MNPDTLFLTALISSLAINFGLSFLVAYVAKEKGRSYAAFFFLSFLVSFLIGLLVVLVIPKRDRAAFSSKHSSQVIYQNGTKYIKCPYCAESVLAEAKICKHCGKDIAKDVNQILNAESAAAQKAIAEARDAKEAEAQKRIESFQNFKKSKSAKALIAAIAAIAIVFAGGILIRQLNPSETDRLTKLASDSKSIHRLWADALLELGLEANKSGIEEFDPAVLYDEYYDGNTLNYSAQFSTTESSLTLRIVPYVNDSVNVAAVSDFVDTFGSKVLALKIGNSGSGTHQDLANGYSVDVENEYVEEGCFGWNADSCQPGNFNVYYFNWKK